MRAALIAAALLSAACVGSGGVPRPDAVMAAAAGTGIEDLERGRRLYVTSCSGCHTLYRIDALDQAGWDTAVTRMASRAKLDYEDRRLLHAYLMAASR